MDGFKEWLHAHESNARKRAAMNPGIPAQAGLVFSKQPYSAEAFCKKIKSPGVRLDNMNVDDVCGKGENKTKEVKKSKKKKS
jgi:hypothetical protein